MIDIVGNNLGEKHRYLNAQVLAAKLNNTDFDDAVAKEETCDTDKLFKIDLASEHKNINYIVNILKCGDSLYITRGLKSVWIFDDKYSNIVNPDNLQQNIFPFMSLKMKKKFLTTTAINLQCKNRAAAFYTYCINIKLTNIAAKFLILTSDDFKLGVIQKEEPFHSITNRSGDDKYIKHFIGNSFELARAYLESIKDFLRDPVIYTLRYLYSISQSEYLDLLEKYDSGRSRTCRFGLRISKSIMQKHKDRVSNNIKIYINVVNKNILTKYINENDCRLYLKFLLPDSTEKFWKMNYCKCYKFIIDFLPNEERFETVKVLFKEKYNEEFETKVDFYQLHYYKLMTPAEQNAWALYQISNNREILGNDNEYLWYRFIDFKNAFIEIKKYVMITTDTSSRLDILKVLIESAKNQDDLKKLFTYFYDRHVNELNRIKESFLTEVIVKHNIFEFDDECWTAFDKVLYSMNIYNITTVANCRSLLFLATLMYHILKKKELHDAIKKYLNDMRWYRVWRDMEILYTKLNFSQQETIYEYLLQWYTKKVQSMEEQADDEKVRSSIRHYIEIILNMLIHHKKTKEQCPDVVSKFVYLDWDYYKSNPIFYEKRENFTDDNALVRQLKKDARVVGERLDEIKNEILKSKRDYRINQFLRKVKIYFSHDLAKDYLLLLLDILKSTDTLNMFTVRDTLYGIMQLADQQTLNDLLLKYAPTEPKIDHDKVNSHLLNIQIGICRFACFACPPVSLSNIRMYIKGDYVQFCLPMFNYYANNLPLPLCLKFIESLLDGPVSVHKHGLRLAFSCFNEEQLKSLIIGVWKRRKNVSVRLVAYNALFNHIINGVESEQMVLFPVLKSCTLDLKEDDQNDIYRLINSNRLPDVFLSEYIECAWQAVDKLSFDKTTNLDRKENVVRNMINSINLLKIDFVKSIIEKHINDMLCEGGIRTKYKENVSSLHMEIWKLTASYIIYFADQQLQKNSDMASLIIKKCIESWHFVQDETYTIRQFCSQFIGFLIERRHDNKSYECVVPIFEVIIKHLQDSLSVFEIYLMVWDLQLSIAEITIVHAGKNEYNTKETAEDKAFVMKQTILNFAYNVENQIKDRVLNRMYFSCFNNEIKDKVISTLGTIKICLDYNDESEIEVTDLRVIFAMGLLQNDMFETYLLAAYILPNTSVRHWSDDYEHVINKIRAFDSLEIKSYLYKKLINSDFKRRRFI
ncbi:uncharacterized protein LOC116413257 [Galleria mellonella]|uniref:Uncharacterized protein LOC116413257 n=1 Tax=Galleria mellonella TaxID=7137 RepID=A0A6J3C386_GALME|nr:uncharacterized protein LOC116413257 [Galleria mellonella]